MKEPRNLLAREDDVLTVLRSPQNEGVFLTYLTHQPDASGDAFHVGISWISLERLMERAQRKVFSWEMKDHSLGIEGRGGIWTLSFTMLAPPFSSITLALSLSETADVYGTMADCLTPDHPGH